MNMSRSTFVRLVAVIVPVSLGCTEAPATSQAVRHRAFVARVDTLRESDSLFVARISRALVTPDGHLIVTDQVQRRVVEFDATGRPVRTFGRKGDGPGEFQGPTALTLWGRDSLVVTDISNRQISVFRRSDGSFLWRTSGLGSVSSAAPIGERLVVASLSPDPFMAAIVIDRNTRAGRRVLAVADSLTRDQLSVAAFPRSVVAARDGRVVSAFLWSDVASVYDSTLALQFTFAVPRRARRSIPPNLADTLLRVLNGSGRMTLIPALMTMEWLGNGRLAFVYKDWIAPPEGIADPARIVMDATLRVYATVVELDRLQACADVELPADWAENPHFLSDGRTLAGLGHVVGDSSRPTLELRRLDLRLEQCDWQPLAAVRPNQD